jgi:hypothetical protein
MKWFLIAYVATGLSVAVSPPQKYSFAPRDKQWCDTMSDVAAYIFAERPDKDLAFVCEQHRKRPKLTGKVDREAQSTLDNQCFGYGNACESKNTTSSVAYHSAPPACDSGKGGEVDVTMSVPGEERKPWPDRQNDANDPLRT